MPPHCDTMDGPVVKNVRMALEKGDVRLILPWAPKEAEAEITSAFRSTLEARALGPAAARVADMWFFETVVRLHRAGEGAPYTGLKPAGLDWGPVVNRAEKAIETGDPTDVVRFVAHEVEHAMKERFDRAMALKAHAHHGVDAEREYVHAMLGFVLSSHHLWAGLKADVHGEGDEGHGGHGH
jgi:hypothetical protein